jgi:predicted AlkP superfamily pyrophosphatase or phosphodiesterase
MTLHTSAGAPDVLAIGLSATDYVGHIFGTEGAEMCAQLLGVDDNVGRILAALDASHMTISLFVDGSAWLRGRS